MSPKVSIILTIYNCEEFIEKCVRSAFEQTLKEIEYIFVNDATPDNSIDRIKNILELYPNRKPFAKIIDIETNAGVSNARQVGIKHATGEYVIHLDSDDWVDNTMYETLYKKAKETDADVIGCNFIHEFIDTRYEFHQQYGNNMVENISRLINGRIFPSLCTSLTRRALITDYQINFPQGLNMGEDLFFNLQVYLRAKKIASINWAPYHYRHTENSSCVKRTKKSIESDIAIAGQIETTMRKEGLYNIYSHDIEYRKFYSKLPLMNNLNDNILYHAWLTIYPETNKHIWSYSLLDWKQKFRLWLAANRLLFAAKAFQRLLTIQHQIRNL